MSRFEPPVPTPRDEPVWLQPFPDALLEGAVHRPPVPGARYEQAEAISLAFVTALQVLPPRQVAVLILRDVLGFHASEVPGMLEVTVGSVNGALKRARASLQGRRQLAAGRQPPPGAGSPAEDAIVAKFARVWESADLAALQAARCPASPGAIVADGVTGLRGDTREHDAHRSCSAPRRNGAGAPYRNQGDLCSVLRPHACLDACEYSAVRCGCCRSGTSAVLTLGIRAPSSGAANLGCVTTAGFSSSLASPARTGGGRLAPWERSCPDWAAL